jgi:hypothetical protein
MAINSRFSEASKAAGWHLLFSAAFALASAAVVLGIWYPFPYRELSGGRELFLLIIGVDVVCGPLMTLILFNPRKPRRELWLDLGLVALLQLVALLYGTWTAWQARPMYLALEKDRFKVVMSADLRKSDLEKLPSDLAPLLFGGVKVVALRPPNSTEERNKVLFESIETGRDYAERPEFYIAYKGTAALNSLALAKPLEEFFKRYPDQQAVAIGIAKNNTEELNDWKYLPVLGRQDWVALLDKEGAIRGFLKGDGF